MFSFINRDHIIGIVVGAFLVLLLSFATGCTSECEEDTLDTGVTEDTDVEDTDVEDTDVEDTDTDDTDTDDTDTEDTDATGKQYLGPQEGMGLQMSSFLKQKGKN